MADILPLDEAVAAISAKTPIGSLLRSAEWEQVPLALRQRAQFSAGVTSARVLQAIQDRLQAEIKQQRETLASGVTATFDRSSFIDSLREIARSEGLTPVKAEDRGTVRDITSIPRLGLIYDMQKAQAAGFARHQLDTSEGALALYPAYRLSDSTAAEPRPLPWWERRWFEAGNAVGWQGAVKSEFVALKTSPIWAKLSRFGTPWPPFDWGSTRELLEVDRNEAIALGLITESWTPPAGATGGEDFNQNLEASASGLGSGLIDALKKMFSDQIAVVGDRVQWTAAPAPKTLPPPVPVPASPPTTTAATSKPAPNPTAPPAKVPANKPATEQLVNRLQQQKFNAEVVRAAEQTPEHINALLQNANYGFAGSKGAHYVPGSRTIKLNKSPRAWGGGVITYHHENGHHIHYQTGAVTNSGTHPDFAAAIAADRAHWEQSVTSRHGADWRKIYRRNSMAMLDEVGALIGVGKFDKAANLEGAKRISRITDTIMGLTQGQYGMGHKYGYMLQHGDKEIFAHTYGALMTNDAEFQKQFPSVVAYVKLLLKV